jgi:hypothetical protein
MKTYPFLLRVSSFTGRAVVFFFISSLLAFFFYLLGNYQDFLDSTQLFLLAVLHVSLILQLACSVYLAAFLVLRSIREHKVFLARFIMLALSMAVCGGLLVSMRFLQSWLQA